MTSESDQLKQQATRYAAWFGCHLRRLRTRAGLTQKAAAERLGVAQSRIAEFETQRYAPTWETVVRIALAFDVSADTFMREPPPDLEKS